MFYHLPFVTSITSYMCLFMCKRHLKHSYVNCVENDSREKRKSQNTCKKKHKHISKSSRAPKLHYWFKSNGKFCWMSELCLLVELQRWRVCYQHSLPLLVFFYFYFKKRKKKIYHLIVASIDVLQSFFAHTCCQIQFTLFCPEFNFVTIYTLFSGNLRIFLG